MTGTTVSLESVFFFFFLHESLYQNYLLVVKSLMWRVSWAMNCITVWINLYQNIFLCKYIMLCIFLSGGRHLSFLWCILLQSCHLKEHLCWPSLCCMMQLWFKLRLIYTVFQSFAPLDYNLLRIVTLTFKNTCGYNFEIHRLGYGHPVLLTHRFGHWSSTLPFISWFWLFVSMCHLCHSAFVAWINFNAISVTDAGSVII